MSRSSLERSLKQGKHRLKVDKDDLYCLMQKKNEMLSRLTARCTQIAIKRKITIKKVSLAKEAYNSWWLEFFKEPWNHWFEKNLRYKFFQKTWPNLLNSLIEPWCCLEVTKRLQMQ
jgi:hypothetical protein